MTTVFALSNEVRSLGDWRKLMQRVFFILLLRSEEDVITELNSLFNPSQPLVIVALYRYCAERKCFDASLSDFSSHAFHLDLKSRVVAGPGVCACNAIEPGGFDNIRSNGEKEVEV